jgi:hypothetical protein
MTSVPETVDRVFVKANGEAGICLEGTLALEFL